MVVYMSEGLPSEEIHERLDQVVSELKATNERIGALQETVQRLVQALSDQGEVSQTLSHAEALESISATVTERIGEMLQAAGIKPIVEQP